MGQIRQQTEQIFPAKTLSSFLIINRLLLKAQTFFPPKDFGFSFFFFDKLFPAKRLRFFTDWIFRAKTFFFLLKAFAVKRLTFLLTDCFRPKDFPPLLKARVTLQPNIGSCISSSRNVEEILRFLFRISTRWFSKRNNGVSLCLLSRNCNGYLTAYLLISSSP